MRSKHILKKVEKYTEKGNSCVKPLNIKGYSKMKIMTSLQTDCIEKSQLESKYRIKINTKQAQTLLARCFLVWQPKPSLVLNPLG